MTSTPRPVDVTLTADISAYVPSLTDDDGDTIVRGVD